MPFQLSWGIEGEQQLSRNLRGISERMGDWTPAFRESVKELKDVFSNDVFRTEGRAVQEAWPPLKPSYLAQKRAQGFSTDTLVKTGKMKRAFRSMFDPNSARVWNTARYFKYHQSNKARRGNLPRRVMMKISNDQKETVVRIFHKHFIKKIKLNA